MLCTILLNTSTNSSRRRPSTIRTLTRPHRPLSLRIRLTSLMCRPHTNHRTLLAKLQSTTQITTTTKLRRLPSLRLSLHLRPRGPPNMYPSTHLVTEATNMSRSTPMRLNIQVQTLSLIDSLPTRLLHPRRLPTTPLFSPGQTHSQPPLVAIVRRCPALERSRHRTFIVIPQSRAMSAISQVHSAHLLSLLFPRLQADNHPIGLHKEAIH